MDTSQWVNYALSTVFGSAGGIAATVARFASSITATNKRVSLLEHSFEMLKLRYDEQERQLGNIQRDIDDNVAVISKELADLRRMTGDNAADVQRSLGSIEGTLRMIARNGCARACMTSSPGARGSLSDSEFPIIESPTRSKRG
jgi:hypothetical protein